ncbi:MAG: hypothetical protein CO137_01225 [Candidatus Magasanikbacteria bacterium CG_4_9_14_3_um_filter_32_9]|uniref:Uncharacterized protein n=1 Tax=Candidatus Magasanikbacteria bacterium CG_4_9_14_3_um_filter_32_9 TaxID=1974644 RepID=A0A2M7Z7A0_9BACT|nr:MAG: hypothetical protein CO137_01225 [Candidatus Magasanikbacteria bacterium CG_4_9_14_3_um_filter_32_9]
MTNEINFNQGTIVITATINQSTDPNVTMFNFFEYKSNEGEISLKLRNKTKLIFIHKYKDKTNNLAFDFTDYFDKSNQIAVTWSLEEKELNLYINGKPKKKINI